MPNSWLLETNFNGGMQETHYFNGRLLTADALKTDQVAVQTRQDWLGTATGYGVITGLVARKVPTGVAKISITQGFGINYAGHILHLPGDMTLDIGQGTSQTPAVVANTTYSTAKKPGTFSSTRPQQKQQRLPVQGSTGTLPEGVYLLTMLPATQFAGLAPMKTSVGGVSNGVSNAPGCGSRWEVEGVHFKVIRLDSSNLSTLFANIPDIALDDAGKLRQNLLAHWCYGTLIVRDFGLHPFDFSDQYSPLNPNAPFIPDLSADDLPLAAFHWDGSQLSFVDEWAARRRITHPDAIAGTKSSLQGGAWTALLDDRRTAENQARFRQFQDQLDGIVAAGTKAGSGVDLLQVKVTDGFTFLPPVGFLPVTQECLQTLLCNLDEKPRPGRTSTESNQWGVDFQLKLSEADMRMLGEFTGGAVGTLVNTLFPVGALVGTTGGILARMAGGLGSLLHMAPAATPATQDMGAVLQDLMQRVQSLEGQGQQPAAQTESAATYPPRQPQQQQFSLEASLQGHSQTQRTEAVHPRVRFHERICITLQKPRTTATGSPRSKTEGFNLITFFDGYLLRISLIGKDRIDLLLNESWYEDAIDLRPDRHPDPPEYPVEKGLHRMPLLFDIYLVEENLLDVTQPLYVIFHKALHPTEIIRYYKHHDQAAAELLPAAQAPTEEILPSPQSPTEDIFPTPRQGPGSTM